MATWRPCVARLRGWQLLLVWWLAWVQATPAGREGAFINYSETGCKDASSWCPLWAEEGECDKNPSLANETCLMSCGACAATELEPLKDKDGVVVLHTSFGKIPIRLLIDEAQSSCALVHNLATSGVCGACQFYRNELPPKEGKGPPYGLLQGSMRGLMKLPKSEGHITMKRGHVAFIPRTLEFFISAMDHSEWGDAHIVWGEVTDMNAVDKILREPFHEYKHPEYGTIMRMMNHNVPFTITYNKSIQS